ncbi:MAG: hypothetical protein QXU13_01765 [Desulfurococcaceae archaeon]
MLKAFKRYDCYIFEHTELERIRDLIVKAEIQSLVEVKQVDPRYPYIYIVAVRKRLLEQECISRVNELLSKGEISQDEYKWYRRELVEQCIISMEREKSKEVSNVLEKYLERLRASFAKT